VKGDLSLFPFFSIDRGRRGEEKDPSRISSLPPFSMLKMKRNRIEGVPSSSTGGGITRYLLRWLIRRVRKNKAFLFFPLVRVPVIKGLPNQEEMEGIFLPPPLLGGKKKGSSSLSLSDEGRRLPFPLLFLL